MENYASAQFICLLRAVLSGLAAGFLYDLLRSLRLRRRRSLLLTHLLDGLYVLFLGAVGLYLTLRVGGGELRLYLIFGAAGGALLWFSLLADFFRPLWDWWLDTVLSFFGFLWRPLARVFALCRKLWLSAKKGFIFLKEHAIITLSRCRSVRFFHHGDRADFRRKKSPDPL